MKDENLVSVYLPTFNRLNLLRRAVDSVLTQSYTNLELLIVDDGSTDGTIEYLAEIIKIDKRVRVLQKTGNKGAPSSRNLAIFNAKGVYITGLDDDDFFSKNHIANLVKSYRADFSFIFCRKFNWKDLFFSPLVLLTKRVTFKRLLYSNIVGNQIFTETKKLQAVKGFRVEMPTNQDYDTWLKLARIFGQSKMVISNSYQVDNQHGGPRISDDVRGKQYAIELLIRNHDVDIESNVYNSFLLRLALLKNLGFKEVPLKCFLLPWCYRDLALFFKLKLKGVLKLN